MLPARTVIDRDVWAALKTHFEEASDLSSEDRQQYLGRVAQTDPQMAAMLTELLQPESVEFLDAPPWRPRSEALPGRSGGIFRVGDVLHERFEIEELLGQGGAGEVYRAYDRHREIRIALKALRPSRIDDFSSMDSLRNELNIATRVSHPNVCRLFDITVAPPGAGNTNFITMELLAGESLAARVRKGPLPTAEAYPIVQQLINGLAAAHALGIVHRDLKSANVLLVPAQSGVRAVITDFGLAKEIRAGADLTVTVSEVAGTPAYMAPEQLAGKPASRAADIHALGVVMFEMVTGRLPFEGDTPLEIAAARLHGEAPSPRRYAPDLDRRWEQAILACLDRTPEKRPASAFEILPLLELAPNPKWPRRLVAGVLAVGLIAGAYLAVKPPVRKPEAEAAFEKGLIFNQRRTAEGVLNAIRQFQRATELEPRWAGAWSSLADAYGAASNGEIMDPPAALALARSAARRAIALDNKLARAHGSLGWALSLDFDEWPNADGEFRRAIELDGKDPEVRRWFAVYLRKTGRFREAESQLRAGLLLTHSNDPRLHTELAFLLFTSRQIDRFHAEVQEAHALFPNDSAVEFLQAKSLELRGKYAEALEVLTYVERLGMTRALVLALKAGVAASSGDKNEARRLALEVEHLWQSQPVDGLVLAGVYARIGDTDRAFEVIGEAYRRKDNTLLSLATSPWVDGLRSSPRFHEWLLRLHFTDQIMQRMEFKLSSVSGSGSHPRRTGTS